MGNKKSLKKGVPFWGKLCACLVCAIVAVGAAGDSTQQMKAAGASSIASLEQKAKEIAEQTKSVSSRSTIWTRTSTKTRTPWIW